MGHRIGFLPPPGPIAPKENAMVTFILRPVDVGESSVVFQLLVDSPTRKQGFSANCVMTQEEFVAFRRTLIKGVKDAKDRSLTLHPNLRTLREEPPEPKGKKSKKKKK